MCRERVDWPILPPEFQWSPTIGPLDLAFWQWVAGAAKYEHEFEPPPGRLKLEAEFMHFGNHPRIFS